MRFPLLTTVSLTLLVLAACSAPLEMTDAPVPTAATTQIFVTATPVPATPAPLPTTILERYTVRNGDTLSGISQRFDMSVDDLIRLNGIVDPNALRVGQTLKITVLVTRAAPTDRLVPDSEVVYGPAYASFDVAAFANRHNGYLAAYRERAEGEWLTGPQIIQLVSERYSVGPRVLLTLLEMQSGWVTDPTPSQIAYPMGLIDPLRQGLFLQAAWAASHLNEGYYGKLTAQLVALKFKDRTRARLASTVNPGTAAVQNVLALNSTWEAWGEQIGPGGFVSTYRFLFGDPNAFAVEPLIPPDLKQPPMRLPWNDGEMWYFSGGPHSAWGDSAAWSAIDLTPNDIAGSGSCLGSRKWATAPASGRVVRAEHGRVVVSLGNGDFQGSGWALLFMHIASAGRVTAGAQLNTGDHIGHPSCEGGNADASHLHLARLYNGQWIATDAVPLVLSGWTVATSYEEYDGKMIRGTQTRDACSCRDDARNGIIADSGNVKP